jgi:hypothetical protein
MALGLGLGRRGRGVAVPRIITATVSPVLQPLTNAQTPADGWLASANQTANYNSTAGTIVSAVREVSINGGAFTTTLNQDLLPGDTVAGRVIVTDSESNTRTFGAGSVAVSTVAVTFSSPATITGTATVGQTLTVSATATGGVGAITLARQWRRNGAAISGATGATYVLVEEDDAQSVDVVVTATDSEGTFATSTAAAVSVVQVITYTDTDPVFLTFQAVEAGDTVADAFPPGVEALGNFQSSAGDIVSVTREYNLNGTGWVSEAVALVTEIAMGGVTFTFSEPVEAGLDQTGRAYVVDPGDGVTVTAISPAQSTDSTSKVINGAQLNPAINQSQGYDQRLTGFNVAQNTTVPISLSAGDRLVKVISAEESTVDLISADGPFWRDGHIIEYASLHCVTTAPTATQVLRASTTWTGDTTPEVYTCDLDAIYAARTTYSAANISWPTYASLVATSGQYWPSRAHRKSQSDYEQLGPRGFGGVAGANEQVNFGQDMAVTVGNLMLATTLDPAAPACPYTEAQIKDLMARALRNGIEFSLPWVYSGLSADPPAGGIMQFDQGLGVLALDWLGLGAQKATFIDRVRGNWLQAFEISQANLSDFAPHINSVLPWFSRERTLPTQTGTSTQVTIGFTVTGFGGPNDMQRDAGIGAGARIVRISDGVEATVVSAFDVPNSTGTPTLTVNLTGASPFSAGNVVYIKPAVNTPLQAGTYEWTLRGYAGNERFAFSPGAGVYRNTQSWGGAILALHAHDAWISELDRVGGYWELVQRIADYPSAATNYTFSNDGIAPQYLAENWLAGWSPLTAPSAFVVGNWTLGGGGNVSINTLPNNGGRFITAIEYRLDGGSWTAASGITDYTTAYGNIEFVIPSYAGQNVEIRAANAIGAGATSDVKGDGEPSEADINSITYDAGGAVIDYDGTLAITYDAAGAEPEAT